MHQSMHSGSIARAASAMPMFVFLRRDDHQCFSCCATASLAGFLAADENLIDLHHASESVPSGSYHGSPKFV